MAFNMINFLKEDVRLVKNENKIYKLKILFEEEQKLVNFVPKFSQKEAHHELEQVVQAVLYATQNNQTINKLQTDHFVVNVKMKPWGTSQKLGFRQNGVQVPSHPYMIILNVTVKDLDEDDDSNDDEIRILNQTPKSNSSKNVRNNSSAANSNVRVSQKRLPTNESNKTANKSTQQLKGKDDLSNDVLSTQEICDLLDEARQLRETERLEILQQQQKEKRAKEDIEGFATKYAQRIVKEKEKAKNDFVVQRSSPRKRTENSIRNSESQNKTSNSQRSSPQKNTHKNTAGSLDNQKKMSESPSISKSRSPKKNESHRQFKSNHKQITSPLKITRQSNSQSSSGENCEIPDSRNRKRKLSESPQKSSSQSESSPVKQGRGRHRKLDLDQPSSPTARKTEKNQESHKDPLMFRRIVGDSSDESENKRLRLQSPASNKTRKSPRIQKKKAEEKWLNKNYRRNKNNSSLNSGISMTELRSTRRDRHLIEQEELAEDMKLQQLAKSSPKLKQRSSSRVKRRSSLLWDYIVSPVKNMFSK